MAMTMNLEESVRQAQAGSREALEQVVEQIQDLIYGVALRMLWHPDDARDATQEILIRVITHLGSFRFESAFKTWVYRIASNYLITARKSRLEEQSYTFDRFGSELDEYASKSSTQTEVSLDDLLLAEEIKIGCTLGMLLCLDRAHRLAYILGEILEIESTEAADIMEITPVAFRKRLSRARADIVEFMKLKCGIVDPDNSCRCQGRIKRALELRRVDPKKLLFVSTTEQAKQFPVVISEIQRLDEARRAAALYRSHPEFTSTNFVEVIRGLIDPR